VAGPLGTVASLRQGSQPCCGRSPKRVFPRGGARGRRGPRRAGHDPAEWPMNGARSHSWRDLSARPKAASSKGAQVNQLAYATMRTKQGRGVRRGRILRRGWGRGAGRGGGQKGQGGGVARLAGRGGQALMADFGQAFGPHVLEESLQKVFDG
jgi:hypothetical protein